jgi:hypothetical protein
MDAGTDAEGDRMERSQSNLHFGGSKWTTSFAVGKAPPAFAE